MNADNIEGIPARWWQIQPDSRILCQACPRACKLHEGQRGLCFVRARKNDQMVLTTYNRSSGFCIDPIEKKPLNHFLPGTSILSFGTAGCNLACNFCQNWEISTSRHIDTLADEATPEDIATMARQSGCHSVACTYNDPVVFAEYAIDVAHACHQQNLKAVAVSAGYVEGNPREALYSVMDAVNIDLKAFSDEFYRKECKGALEIVKETLSWLVHHSQTWVEITTLLIPDLNDSDAELHALTGWIAQCLGKDVPLHFTAFRPEHKMRNRPPTPLSTLIRARQIAIQNGLSYVYVGNVIDQGRMSSWCKGCGALLIGRQGYQITHYALDEKGCCPFCKTAMDGHFLAQPGNWGAKRQRVRIRQNLADMQGT